MVFPAHAGMSRQRIFPQRSGWCFPRSRGDEPSGANLLWQGIQFSPLTRG